MLALAVATVALLELGLGGSLAARIGQTTARQTAEPQAPNVELSDFMIAAR
jgi:Flp pilus assembly protein CpaB